MLLFSLCFTPALPFAAGMVSSALELHRYATDRESRVVTAMTMLKSHLFRRAALAPRQVCLDLFCSAAAGKAVAGK